MLFFILLLGFVTGWLLDWASDTFPHRLGKRPLATQPPSRGRLPAVLLPMGVASLTAPGFAYLWSRGEGVYMVVFAFFLLVALIDWKHRLVLNVLVYPGIGVTLLLHALTTRQSFPAVLLGGGLAFATFALVAWLRPGDLGGGDVKLAALIGFLFGFPGVLWPLLVGVILGGITAAFLLARGYGRQHHIAYAPFLCVGVFVALLYNPLG